MGEIKKKLGIWSRVEGPYPTIDGQECFTAFLDWRVERQALPRGSSPLMAFGGRVICGQHWTAEEVREFVATLGWRKEDICVFEYTR